MSTPPRDSQPPQELPSHHLCHMAWSVPTAKISRRLGPQATALGREVSTPPKDSQPPQELPSQHLCHIPWSVPTPKTSRRLGPQVTASGADRTIPPKDCHADQTRGIAVTVLPCIRTPMIMELSRNRSSWTC